MIGTSNCRRNGSFSSMKFSTPPFCRPMAFRMPAGVSTMRGVGLPRRGSRLVLFTTHAPIWFRSTTSAISLPKPKVPEPVTTGFRRVSLPIWTWVFHHVTSPARKTGPSVQQRTRRPSARSITQAMQTPRPQGIPTSTDNWQGFVCQTEIGNGPHHRRRPAAVDGQRRPPVFVQQGRQHVRHPAHRPPGAVFRAGPGVDARRSQFFLAEQQVFVARADQKNDVGVRVGQAQFAGQENERRNAVAAADHDVRCAGPSVGHEQLARRAAQRGPACRRAAWRPCRTWSCRPGRTEG